MRENMEDYDKKIREVVESLSPEEKKILQDVFRIESKYKQTMHTGLSNMIAQEIQKAVERNIK